MHSRGARRTRQAGVNGVVQDEGLGRKPERPPDLRLKRCSDARKDPYWIDQTGAQQSITGYRRAKMASFLDGMFTYMRLNDWPEAPVAL